MEREKNSLLSGVKNLLFDLGGVLVDLDKQACIDAFVNLSFTEIHSLIGETRQGGIFLDLETGAATPDDFCRYVAASAGRPLTNTQVCDALNRFVVGIPRYKLQMLRELAQRYNLFMLSNTNGIGFPHICRTMFTQEGLGVNDYFAHCYLSYQMHACKPDARIFEQVIADGRMRPEETLFLDDAAYNTHAAEAFGFKTYTVVPSSDFRSLFQ